MSKFLIAIQWNGRIGDTFYFLNGYVEFENMRKLPLKIKMFFAIVSISKLFTVRILTFEYLSISMRSWLERVSESLDFNPSRSKNPLVCLSFTSVSFRQFFSSWNLWIIVDMVETHSEQVWSHQQNDQVSESLAHINYVSNSPFHFEHFHEANQSRWNLDNH